jgi:hypothetical protein
VLRLPRARRAALALGCGLLGAGLGRLTLTLGLIFAGGLRLGLALYTSDGLVDLGLALGLRLARRRLALVDRRGGHRGRRRRRRGRLGARRGRPRCRIGRRRACLALRGRAGGAVGLGLFALGPVELGLRAPLVGGRPALRRNGLRWTTLGRSTLGRSTLDRSTLGRSARRPALRRFGGELALQRLLGRGVAGARAGDRGLADDRDLLLGGDGLLPAVGSLLALGAHRSSGVLRPGAGLGAPRVPCKLFVAVLLACGGGDTAVSLGGRPAPRAVDGPRRHVRAAARWPAPSAELSKGPWTWAR